MINDEPTVSNDIKVDLSDHKIVTFFDIYNEKTNKLEVGDKVNEMQNIKDTKNIFKVGDKVEANYRGQGKWYSGVISKVNSLRNLIDYNIDYNDGKYEEYVSEEFIRFISSKKYPITIEKSIVHTENYTDYPISREETQAISSVAYNYSAQNKEFAENIPGVIPQADDDSSVNDLSGNIIDCSGNNIRKTYKKFTYKQIQEEITNN